jgi:hypothetical protein
MVARTARTVAAGAALVAGLMLSGVAAPAAMATPTPTPVTGRSGTVTDSHGRVVGGWKQLGATSTTRSSGASGANGSTVESLTQSYGRQDVGSGVWTYGSYDENGYKHCWSKYYNIYYYHSATAVMSTTKKVYAWQFDYADAHLTESIRIGATCKVYWAIYP